MTTSSSTSGTASISSSRRAPTTSPTVASSSRAGITTLIRVSWCCFQFSSVWTGQSRQCDVRWPSQASARSCTTSFRLSVIDKMFETTLSERLQHSRVPCFLGVNLGAVQATSLDELPGYHVPLDLVGALADDHQRSVPEVPLNVVLGRVAVAPVNAHRVERNLHRALGREQLGHARLHIASLAGLEPLGGVQDELPRGGHLGRHVGQVVADRLVLPDRLSEALPLLGVPQRVVQRGVGAPQRPRGALDAAGLQTLHHLREALALDTAQQRSRG